MTKTLRIAVVSVVMLLGSVAAAAEAPHTLGFGYKIGNGLGLLGADAVLGVGEHLSLGLQGTTSAMRASSATDTPDTAFCHSRNIAFERLAHPLM